MGCRRQESICEGVRVGLRLMRALADFFCWFALQGGPETQGGRVEAGAQGKK